MLDLLLQLPLSTKLNFISTTLEIMPSADLKFEKLFLSRDEAVALAALDAHVKLGSGYPGTPSTEILEAFEKGSR